MSRQPSPEFIRQRWLVAYHEAGHVLGTIAGELPLHRAAIWTVRHWGGLVSVRGKVSHSRRRTTGLNDAQLPGYIVGAYAGLEAEAVFLQHHDGYRADAARQLAYEVSRDGDLEHIAELVARPEVRIDVELDAAAEMAQRLIAAHWASIDSVARALMDHGELFAPDLYRLVGAPTRRAG